MVFTTLNLFALLGCLVILADFNAHNRSLTTNFYNKDIGIINFVDTLNKFLNIIPD